MRLVKNTINRVLLGGLSLILVACHRTELIPAQAPGGVAQVGTNSISPEDFRQLLVARSAGNPQLFASLDAKEALLDELVVREAAYQKARAAGFDQRPEIQDAVKRLIVDKFESEQMPMFGNAVNASSEQIESYYQTHASEFTEAGAVRGAAIFVKIPATAGPDRRDHLMAKAQSIMDQAKAGDPAQFALLAQQNSEDQSSRYRGGDTGWISAAHKTIDPEVATALLALSNPGDFAPLITVKNGVWIAKLTDVHPASVRPLADVKDLIDYKLAKECATQRAKDFNGAMKSGLAITINQDLLNSIAPPPQAAPVAPPIMRSLARAQ